MRRRLRVLACALGLALTGATAAHADNAQFVDPMIGTAAREQPYAKGNTFPGALVPNGMVAISPDTSPRYPGGYRHGAPYIEGFSQNHMSGVGCTGDLGNILLMPTIGAIRAALRGHRSAYHDETAEAGYYKVRLAKGGIVAEMSATRRASISRYTFPARNGDATILIDVSHGLSPSTDGSVRVVSANEVEGFNEAGKFCRGPNPYRLHFVARFSKPATTTGTWTATWFGAATSPASQRVGNDIGAYLSFNTATGEAIEVRLGVSYVSIANARANLDAEIPQGRTFAQVRANAFAEWDKDLGRIRVTGGTPAQRTMFYTALYHALIHPGTNSDVNGQYQGMGGVGVRNDRLSHYHIFSLWDTYRSLHPLLTLAYPKRQQQMVRSMVTMFKESGWLPKWEMVSRERYTMVGDPAGIVIADSYLKGVRGFDVDAAYAAMRKSAATRTGNPLRPCIGLYLDLGYIPRDTCTEKGSASVTQEYAYADHALARLAAALGKTADAELFGRRALAHRDLFDAQTGFLRPRNADGSWAAPFEPLCCGLGNGKFEGPGYIEGTAWQYLFMVPHDIDGLKSLLGGDLAFRRKLDTAFTDAPGYYTLINEPTMLYPYLYTFVPGEAWRTQAQVREDISRYFDTSPAGLPGNDDAGQTSSRLLFDMMGFYPADPLSAAYQLGSPVFTSVTIDLDPAFYPGGAFTIRAPETSTTNKFVQAATLNGNPLRTATLRHADIVRGGSLTLEMGPTASSWGD